MTTDEPRGRHAAAEQTVAVSDGSSVGKVTVIGTVHGSVHITSDPGGGGRRPDILGKGEFGDTLRRRSLLRALSAGFDLSLSDGAAETVAQVRGRTEQLLELGTPARGVLDGWERAVHGHALRYATSPPLAYLSDLLHDVVDLQDLVDACRAPGAQRRALRLLGRLSGMVAVVADDLGRPRESRHWMRLARRLSVESRDRELRAWTFARAGFIALHYSGSAPEASQLARAAVDAAPRLSPAALIMGHTVQSRALAIMGDQNGVLGALGAAEDAQAATPVHDSLGLFDWTEQQAALSRGMTLTTLGRTGPALAAQNTALAMFAPSEWLDPALVRLNQAALLVRQVDIREGCRLAATVLLGVPNEHRSPLLASWADEVIHSIPDRLVAGPEARELVEVRRNFAQSGGTHDADRRSG